MYSSNIYIETKAITRNLFIILPSFHPFYSFLFPSILVSPSFHCHKVAPQIHLGKHCYLPAIERTFAAIRHVHRALNTLKMHLQQSPLPHENAFLLYYFG